MTFMIALRKVWSWLKTYWWIPVGVIATIVLFIVYRPAGSALLKLMKRNHERHKEEIAELDRIRKDEIEKKEKAQEEFDQAMAEEEDRHLDEERKLDQDKRDRVDELVEKHADDPEELTRHLADLGGIRVIERSDDE